MKTTDHLLPSRANIIKFFGGGSQGEESEDSWGKEAVAVDLMQESGFDAGGKTTHSPIPLAAARGVWKALQS